MFTHSNRLGYKTSGGFSIDEFTPVALQDLTPVPPAFRISAGGKKIDGRLPLTRPGINTMKETKGLLLIML